MKPPQRPKRENGQPLPTKYKQLQQGVLIFELTKAQRAKILLGYNVKVSVAQKFQHNPGHIEVAARLDVTEQNQFAPGDRIKSLEQAPEVVSDSVAKVNYSETKPRPDVGESN